MRLALSGALAVAACRAAPVASCQDDLSGIWAAEDGRRFDIVDRGGTVEVYPLFDPVGEKQARPWRTPAKTELQRRGMVLAGTSTFQAQDARVCTVTTPARLEACGDGRASLVVDLAPALDASACAVLPRPVAPMTIRRL